jgi:hypothetical protein
MKPKTKTSARAERRALPCDSSLVTRHMSLEEPINIRRLGVENAYGPHLLQNTVQCLFRRAGAGLGFAEDLFEFGGDDFLAGEDTAFVARGDAVDGGHYTLMPTHVPRILGRMLWCASLRIQKLQASKFQAPGKLQNSSSKRVLPFHFWCFGVFLVLGAWDLVLPPHLRGEPPDLYEAVSQARHFPACKGLRRIV